MAKVKHAFVTGTKPRYILRVHQDAGLAGYEPLHRLEFENYRIAQDVANLVKAGMAKKEAENAKG